MSAVANFLASLGDLTYQEAVANCEADKASYGWSHETSGAIREGLVAHFFRATPSAPENTEALDAYDQLCRDAREATFCTQCGDETTKREGALCTGCALQDDDARGEHEHDHSPGRV